DPVGALGSVVVVRSSLRHAQSSIDRATRRVAAEQRDLPSAGGAYGAERCGASGRRPDVDSPGAELVAREDEGRHARRFAREGLDAAERADAILALRERRLHDAV